MKLQQRKDSQKYSFFAHYNSQNRGKSNQSLYYYHMIKCLFVSISMLLLVQASAGAGAAEAGVMSEKTFRGAPLGVEYIPEDWEHIDTNVSAEKNLVSMLLQRYQKVGKIGRPVLKTSDDLTLYFGMALIQIFNVNEKYETLELSVWQRFSWTDVFLRWAPSLHGGIESIRVPPSEIWLPDIILYNYADERLEVKKDSLVNVFFNGSVKWWPQSLIVSSCAFEIKYFPFDVQTCYLNFGSWAYNGKKLNVQFMGESALDLSSFVTNNEWAIIENSAKRTVNYYSCCPEPYPVLTYKLTLKRRTAFYTFIIVLPGILLTVLTLLTFWVPPESPAKLQLGINIFVAFFLLLLVLADSIPRASSSMPLIGVYFCLSMMMITLSTLLSCIASNMYYHGIRPKRAPAWMRSFIGSSVARASGIETSSPFAKTEEHSHDELCSQIELEAEQDLDRLRQDGDHPIQCQNQNQNLPDQPEDYNDEKPEDKLSEKQLGDTIAEKKLSYSILLQKSRALHIEVCAIRKLLSIAHQRKSQKDEHFKVIQEWRILAFIWDRVTFTLYFIISSFTAIIIFTLI